jgi:pimeloyl-ACP methyl ester carboxylesterase
VTEARPEVGVVLADLREHGKSRGANPPHTLAAAADDVLALIANLDSSGMEVDSIVGHSLGGKIALGVRAASAKPRSTWVLDASPSPIRERVSTESSGSASPDKVLTTLERAGRSFVAKEDFQSRLGELDRSVIEWLAMNLEADGDQFRFGPDITVWRALLEDAKARDLWSSVDDERRGPIHFVIAANSPVVSAPDRDRLEKLAKTEPWVEVAVIPDAGHWLHVDALAALVALVVRGL